jgi:hypothetical protein
VVACLRESEGAVLLFCELLPTSKNKKHCCINITKEINGIVVRNAL